MDETASERSRIAIRGIRGATTAPDNSAAGILEATGELVRRIISENRIASDEVVAIFFTATPDLNATFPARAARELGYVNVPLMCSQEMAVPGAPEKCIRVLMLVEANRRAEQMIHVYLRGAASLRVDLALAKGD